MEGYYFISQWKRRYRKKELYETLMCQVLGIFPDVNTGLVTIDVRVTKLTDNEV